MASAPADMDMAMLSFCFERFDQANVVRVPRGKGHDDGGGVDVYASQAPLCGTAYALTARAARRVLDIETKHTIVDWQLIKHPIQSGVVTAYSPLCPLFNQVHSLNMASAMDMQSLSGHDNRYPIWARPSAPF